jgi:hypothetical protein
MRMTFHEEPTGFRGTIFIRIAVGLIFSGVDDSEPRKEP